jgi:hypothetical protein
METRCCRETSFAPTNLTVRVHVTPDAANRALEVTADSDTYYRSSRIQLDGQHASTTMVLEFRNVPGGDYDVRATLIDSAGQRRADVHKQVQVIPSAADEIYSDSAATRWRTLGTPVT